MAEASEPKADIVCGILPQCSVWLLISVYANVCKQNCRRRPVPILKEVTMMTVGANGGWYPRKKPTRQSTAEPLVESQFPHLKVSSWTLSHANTLSSFPDSGKFPIKLYKAQDDKLRRAYESVRRFKNMPSKGSASHNCSGPLKRISPDCILVTGAAGEPSIKSRSDRRQHLNVKFYDREGKLTYWKECSKSWHVPTIRGLLGWQPLVLHWHPGGLTKIRSTFF